MYFRPAVRGLGLGKALLSRNLARARDAGFDAVTLETATVLKSAIGLYQRFGFEVEGTHHRYAFRDGGYVDAHSMARLRPAV